MSSLRALVLLVLPATLASACVEPGGDFNLTLSGVPGLEGSLDAVAITWDGEVTWTSSVRCTIGGTWADPDYRMAASDRSVGEGFDTAMTIERYDGPDTYARDEFQPTDALSITWTAPDLTEWRLATGEGDACSIDVGDRGRSGSMACTDVAVWSDGVLGEDLAAIQASWNCGEVEVEMGAGDRGGDGMGGGSDDPMMDL